MMSKRRELMMNTTENSWYVQDGLVLHLDGIFNDSFINQSHKDNPTRWNDISGNGYNFAMYHTTTTADSFKFNGTSSYGVNNFLLDESYLNDLLIGTKTRTIEIVCKLNNASGAQTIFLGVGENTPIEKGAVGLWYRQASGGMKVSTLDGVHSVPFTTTNPTERNHYRVFTNKANSGIYTLSQNNVACARTTAAGSMFNQNYICIGTRYYSNAFSYRLNGEICAIRVYDRELALDEKAHNYNLDIERFGLSATTATIEEVTE